MAALAVRRPPALAVGSRTFVEGVQASLGGRARYRHVEDEPGFSLLRETEATYAAHFRPETVSVSPSGGRSFNES